MPPINRRRAATTEISSNKKKDGHQVESEYSKLISGAVITGTKKGDIKDIYGNLHSVKSGKKLQMCLYSFSRISNSTYLNILLPCLQAFPSSFDLYDKDREICISFKENYLKIKGKKATKELSNDDVISAVGPNKYITSKMNLNEITSSVSNFLEDKKNLRNFLGEAFFNVNEVSFLVIKDSTYKKDGVFRVFSKDDVLTILTKNLSPCISKAGCVPQDFNVPGQKTLLRYEKEAGKFKNVCEIEIRNESVKHFRQVRFNMYSRDALMLLLRSCTMLEQKNTNPKISFYEMKDE